MADKNSNNIWDKFDQTIDTAGLAEDVKTAAENGGSYKEVPFGEYEVAIDKLELTASKVGDPMVSVWFKIVSEGEYKGSRIFMNQVVKQGFQIHIVNEFLRSLDSGIDITFDTYKQYGNLLMDVFEALKTYSKKHAESSQKASETLELIATGKHPSGVKATAEELSTARNDLMWQKAQSRESLDEVKRNRRLISKYAENIELLEQYLAKQGV